MKAFAAFFTAVTVIGTAITVITNPLPAIIFVALYLGLLYWFNPRI